MGALSNLFPRCRDCADRARGDDPCLTDGFPCGNDDARAAHEIKHLRAENAELRARVATSREERDDARSAVVLTCERYHEKVAAIEAERDARPAITPEMARDSLRYDNMEWLTSEQRDQLGVVADAAVAALREHAKGAKS